MDSVLSKNQRDRIRICTEMIALKIAYIICTIMILPDNHLLWSYGKEISWLNIIFELFPFLVGSIIYSRQFYRNNEYSFFATLFFILFFIPANSCLVLSNYFIGFYILINLFSFLMLYLIGRLAVKQSHYASKNEIEDYSWIGDALFANTKYVWTFRVIMLLVCVFTLIYVYNYNSLNFSILFSEMYTVRADYAEYAVQIQGTTASYLSMMITKISGWLLPVYLYFAISKKKIIDIAICVFTFIAHYTVEMQKTSLFIIFIVIYAVFMNTRGKLSLSAEYLIKGFIILFLGSYIEYYISGGSVIYELVLRRLMYVPTYLSNVYYDFFSNNVKLWFTQDALIIQQFVKMIIPRPYEGSAVEIISRNCFSGRLASPNTGIFAEAYAQMGMLGIIIFPFIDCYVLKKIKQASEVFGTGASIVVLSKLCFTYLNNFTLTTSTLIGILLFILISKSILTLTQKSRIEITRNIRRTTNE